MARAVHSFRHMLLRRARFAASIVGILSAGCNGAMYAPGPPPPEEITVKVYGDPDEPVGEAEVGTGGAALAKTDAAGVARFKLDGADGSRYDLTVACPADYGGGTRALKIVLRRGSRAPEYTTSCKRTVRTAVIAVKAPGGQGIPVMHLGRELARVDEAGMALVHLDMKVGETFTLMLDTSDPRYKALRPQNPEVSFSVADADELFTFEPRFHEERAIVKRAPPPGPYVPKRLN
ncbi:MAG: hypothetical protein KF819_39035 [Labilithrix sp.]|nr:hypothetical protein [Labilithrix sp.]